MPEPTDVAEPGAPGPNAQLSEPDPAGPAAEPAAAAGSTEPAAAARSTDLVVFGRFEPPEPDGLDALSAAMDSDHPEPRRHWLRYPGFVGALAVFALVMFLPCAAGVLYFNGAFADPGRFPAAPDACSQLTPGPLASRFGTVLSVNGQGRTARESFCAYRSGAAAPTGTAAEVRPGVRLTLTSYRTKGPLSAARMAHVGLNDAITEEADAAVAIQLPVPSRRQLAGIGDETVLVKRDTGEVSVYTRVSNLLVRLDVELPTTDASTVESGTVTTARDAARQLS